MTSSRAVSILVLALLGCGRVEDGDRGSGSSGDDAGAGGSSGGGGSAGTGPWDDVDVARSGSRLKAVWLEAEGGAFVLRHWYDSVLEVACEIDVAQDGVLRCLPTAEVPPLEVSLGADCGPRTAYVVPICRGRTTELWRETSGGFGAAVRRGVPLGRVEVSLRLGDDCFPMQPTDALEVRALGEIVPPEVFVAAAEENEGTSEDRLRRVIVVADDGAVQVRPWLVDSEFGRCSPGGFAGPNGSPVTVCYPETSSENFVELDDAAKKRLVPLESRVLGGGRITSGLNLTGDGRAFPPVRPEFTDWAAPLSPDYGVPTAGCDLETIADVDGEHRCVGWPRTTGAPLYAGADCQERIVPGGDVIFRDLLRCDDELIHTTDGKVQQAHIQLPGGECRLASISGYYRAEPRDPSSFAMLTERTDP